ncbi:MAG: ATP-dependent DNA helicase RecG [Oscillospiraceae bacterium]|nr:ATP-dependent DNA helicase RecG [Oscillospiraceae bacterium]
MKLNTDIKYVKGVGGKRAELLNRLDVRTVGDLLYFFPRAYEDWSKITKIRDAVQGETCCVKAFVDRKPTAKMIRKGMILYKTDVTDGTAVMQITIFNSEYAASKLREGEEFLFFGKVSGGFITKEMSAPLIEKAEGGERIRPVYRQTEGLSSAVIEKLVRSAYEAAQDELTERLSDSLCEKYVLCGVRDAIWNIHFPQNADMLGHARRRLVFEELLILRLGLTGLKNKSRATTELMLKKDYSEEFFGSLPFNPTNAQRKATAQAVKDMSGAVSMNRLLQGDVGSGKTAVAAALVYSAAKNGMQSAVMAPTEVLAAQHCKTMEAFFCGTDVSFMLMTGSTKAAEKRDIKGRLESGEIDLIIGTHALIQDDVRFKNLGFVVTDEQHRFGVRQRAILGCKGENPHTLVMSATPIPRTLALMIYGDLDISVLDELPPGRTPVKTFAITGDKRVRVYNYIKKHLDQGLQGYIVCPLVEEGETELAAAQEYAQGLSAGAFMGYRVGLLHGRMKGADKERVMSDFAAGAIQLLVSTTVIEVGVDVANAVIMLIENAERFGLSQLHQLRGRIGRGKDASTCILLSDAQNAEAKRRLEIMTQTTDGFKIADEDLKLRGPGDFFGSRQHGLPELKIADMLDDSQILREAADAAKGVIEGDPALSMPENAGLKRAVNALFAASPQGSGVRN